MKRVVAHIKRNFYGYLVVILGLIAFTAIFYTILYGKYPLITRNGSVV